ncbi:MAG: F0F1 ATP synthase subunit B [Chloroflexi bacterium]|nr:F0F1 ATP synthase subunit B [Chloroflexota bacterium]
MQELGLDLGLLLSQIVNFGLLAIVLSLLLYRPILRKLEERANRINKGLDDAERAQQMLAEAQVEYQNTLERARREAHEITERATRLAEQQRQEILAQARQDASDIVARTEQQAQRQIDESQLASRQQIIDLAVAIASRLIAQNLDEAKHHELIEEFLAEVEQLK